MMDLERKAVIVVGMHRSGTSAVTKALSTAGVCLGDSLIPGNFANQKGYFEDHRIVDLNEEILSELDCRWQSVFVPRTSGDKLDALAQRAALLANTLLSGKHMFGFKDPRTTRLFRFWDKLLDDCGVERFWIIANRSPFSVAKSLRLRDGYPGNFSLVLWLAYQVDALRILSDQGGLVVAYDRLLKRPGEELDRIAGFLDTAVDPKKKRAFLESFLDRGLRRADDLPEDVSLDLPLVSICERTNAFFAILSGLPGGSLTPSDRQTACNLIGLAEKYLEENKLWIAEMDALGLAEEVWFGKRIGKKDKEIARLVSRLDWIESHFPYSWYKAVKARFSSSR